ncbi:MAG: transposase, partial [Pseudomonadota bacterium]
KRYWGKRFWGRGYFSATSGAITEELVENYLKKHIQNPTGASR